MTIDKLLVIPKLDKINEYIELASEYNCGYEYNDFFVSSVLDDNELSDQIVSAYKKVEGLPGYTTLHGAFLDINIASSDKEIFKVSDMRVRQSIDIARKLGVKGVVFHTNYIANFNQDAYREEWVKSNVAYWKNILREYTDIEVYIENMFDMDYELIWKLAKTMADEARFGICLDYAHAHVFGDETKASDWVMNLAPYVKHVHINDNDFVSDLHLAVGDGSIDWKMFKVLYENYMSQASVLIEVSDIEKARKSLEYLGGL